MATTSKRRCGTMVTDSGQKRSRVENSGFVDNWQAGKTVTECNLHMLTTEDCSDVIFLVGAEKQVVRAHRYVLVSRSSVFYAMFCGPLAEKGEVTIPDIEPDVFREFLRYMYSEKANITFEIIIGLLYASRKYAVDGLTKVCLDTLNSSLSEENVCMVLEACHVFHMDKVEKKALDILTSSGSRLVTSSSFHDLCHGCFEKYLQSDDLKLSEKKVFEATMSWAQEKCKRRNQEATPESIREEIGDLKYEIRFASLSLEFLVKAVKESGILTNDERLSLLDRSVCPDIDTSPFNKRIERSGQNYHHVLRFGDCDFGWQYQRFFGEEIHFSVNKDIELLGVCFYGSKEHTKHHFVSLKVQDDSYGIIRGATLNGNYRLKLTKDQSQKWNEVFLRKPVPIKKDMVYTVSFNVKGGRTYFGVDGKTTCSGPDGVQFKFLDDRLSFGRNNTRKGQLPGLLYKCPAKK